MDKISKWGLSKLANLPLDFPRNFLITGLP